MQVDKSQPYLWIIMCIRCKHLNYHLQLYKHKPSKMPGLLHHSSHNTPAGDGPHCQCVIEPEYSCSGYIIADGKQKAAI